MPTLGTFLQMVPLGFRSLPHRSTDGTIYCCVEGHGTIRLGDEVFEWGPRDIFVAPWWQARTLTATTNAVLFGYSTDRCRRHWACCGRKRSRRSAG